MSTLPAPPAVKDLAVFPALTWAAHQPLWRVHRECRTSVHFATGQGSRFNAPSPSAEFGTWYLSTHPRGAFIEVFGRLLVVTRHNVDERVLAQIFLPSDLRLADLTHPTVIGRFGITNELSMGGEAVYPIAQDWAQAFWLAGFAGIHYSARHDTSLETRSVAIFGKPEDGSMSEGLATITPLSETADDLAASCGLLIVSGRSL